MELVICFLEYLHRANCRSEVNLGLPEAEGRNRFTRIPSEESLKSCVSGSRASGSYSMLDDAATLMGDVGYVIDKKLGVKLRAKAGELGQSLEEKLDR